MRRIPGARGAALAAVVVLGLTGCGSPSGTTGPAQEGTDPALAAFYGQELDWGSCADSGGLAGWLGGGDLECAQLSVPVDYADPNGESLEVAVSRLPSTGDAAQGALLVNPGGPGGSGVDLMGSAEQLFGEDIPEAYDIVSFDPRGVSRSAGIECFDDDAQRDAWRSQPVFDPQEQSVDELRQEYRELGEDCAQRSGPVLEHMSTAEVARDLDVLRAALGQTEADYLGFSYGTHIGAEYAELFPQRVGRFVLDAAVDPSAGAAETALAQAEGFEGALRSFLEHCLASEPTCFADGSAEEAAAEVQRILARPEAEEITGPDGRRVTAVQATEGVIAPLYSTATYSTLNEALLDAQAGDYDALQGLSDQNHGRQPDGSYQGNSTVSFTAVSCLDAADDSVTDARMAAHQQELNRAAPTFGPYLGYGEAACQGWPAATHSPAEPVDSETDAPILVIGVTEDPATPYAWSEALTEQLGTARLLTRDGAGHISYSSGNGCIVEAANRYLLEGTLPEEGTVCTDVSL